MAKAAIVINTNVANFIKYPEQLPPQQLFSGGASPPPHYGAPLTVDAH